MVLSEALAGIRFEDSFPLIVQLFFTAVFKKIMAYAI